MKFCPECGNNIEGVKFCSECGFKVGADVQAEAPKVETETGEETILEFTTYLFGMENQKANIGGKFDLSIPQESYTLTSERLVIEQKGVVSKKREEIELYKVKDITVKQKMKDKLMKVGDVEIISNDPTTPIYLLKRIREPHNVREAIRTAVRSNKKNMNVGYREEL